MSFTIDNPVNYFPQVSKFGAVGGGSLYIGVVDGDPANVPADRIQVYKARQNDTDLAISQPISLSPGGVPMHNGAAITIKNTGVEFSMQVIDSQGQQVFYSPKSGEIAAAILALQAQIAGLDFIAPVETFAALATTPAPVSGMIVYTKQHTSGGVGGGYFQDTAGTITNNGGTLINNTATAGRHWKAINYANITPEMFGCIGDGSTNDAANFQLALTAAAGKTLVCRSGATYKSNSGLTIPANTAVSAWGAKFDFSNSHITGFTMGAGSWLVGSTEIKGAGNSSYNALGIGVNCTGTNNSPSAPTFVDGPVILHNTFRGWGAYGVKLVYCNKSHVDFNNFYNIGYTAIGGQSQNEATAIGNYIEDVSPGSGGDCYGIEFGRLNGTSETADPRSYRCKINGNTITGVICAAANNGHALDTHGGVEIEFLGNTITNCEGGIFITSSSVVSTETLGPKRCIAANNTINCSLRNNYAIIVRGAISGGSVIDYADANEVSGNTIYGGGVSGSNTTGAIMLEGTKNTNLGVGTITESSPFGVCLNGDNLNFNISGGTIEDCYDGSVVIAGGIGVRGNNNTGYIGGISFRYETAGLGTYVMVNSIVVSSGLTGIDIDLGRCSFSGIDATHLTFSDGVGINSESLYGHSKTENFTLTSGNSSTVKSVSFAKRFPSVPKVSLTNSGAISPGGKTMSLRTSNITATGFDIIAYPYDLSTWSATAAADINWRATT